MAMVEKANAGKWPQALVANADTVSKMTEIPKHIYERYTNPGRTTADCGEGWLDIILRMDEAAKSLDENYKVFNIKEKYGVLDFQIAGSSETWEMHEAIEAVNTSHDICEWCGAPGRFIHMGDTDTPGGDRVRCIGCEPAHGVEYGEAEATYKELAKHWQERAEEVQKHKQILYSAIEACLEDRREADKVFLHAQGAKNRLLLERPNLEDNPA